MCLCACEHVWELEDISHIGTCVEAEGQFVGIGSLCLPHESRGSNSKFGSWPILMATSTIMISIATIKLSLNT